MSRTLSLLFGLVIIVSIMVAASRSDADTGLRTEPYKPNPILTRNYLASLSKAELISLVMKQQQQLLLATAGVKNELASDPTAQSAAPPSTSTISPQVRRNVFWATLGATALLAIVVSNKNRGTYPVSSVPTFQTVDLFHSSGFRGPLQTGSGSSSPSQTFPQPGSRQSACDIDQLANTVYGGAAPSIWKGEDNSTTKFVLNTTLGFLIPAYGLYEGCTHLTPVNTTASPGP